MSESFRKFKKTGKIEDYLKYRSEVSKELSTKSDKENTKEPKKKPHNKNSPKED